MNISLLPGSVSNTASWVSVTGMPFSRTVSPFERRIRLRSRALAAISSMTDCGMSMDEYRKAGKRPLRDASKTGHSIEEASRAGLLRSPPLHHGLDADRANRAGSQLRGESVRLKAPKAWQVYKACAPATQPGRTLTVTAYLLCVVYYGHRIVRHALVDCLRTYTFRRHGHHQKLLQESDSNRRPPGYEPGELPTAPPCDANIANRPDIRCQGGYKIRGYAACLARGASTHPRRPHATPHWRGHS